MPRKVGYNPLHIVCRKVFWNKRLRLIWFHLYEKLLWLLLRFCFLWNLKIVILWYKFMCWLSPFLCVEKINQFFNKGMCNTPMIRLCQVRLVWPQVWHWGKKNVFYCISISFFGFHLQLLITLLRNVVEMLCSPEKH